MDFSDKPSNLWYENFFSSNFQSSWFSSGISMSKSHEVYKCDKHVPEDWNSSFCVEFDCENECNEPDK